jgi:formylglycine-generating enzyme required for sulfatase activity
LNLNNLYGFEITRAQRNLRPFLLEFVMKEKTLFFENLELSIDFVEIPPGQFEMGTSIKHDSVRFTGQPRQVTITKSFWLSKYPITEKQFERVLRSGSWYSSNVNNQFLGHVPDLGNRENHPKTNVTWEEACQFCALLTHELSKAQHDMQIKLPTEAQWEYTCRAGKPDIYPCNEDSFNDYIWSCFNSSDNPLTVKEIMQKPIATVVQAQLCKQAGCMVKPVGQKIPNDWGLHDMLGNVSEYCADSFLVTNVQTPLIDPIVETTHAYKVVRGGCCILQPSFCNAVTRSFMQFRETDKFIGFRIVLNT